MLTVTYLTDPKSGYTALAALKSCIWQKLRMVNPRRTVLCSASFDRKSKLFGATLLTLALHRLINNHWQKWCFEFLLITSQKARNKVLAVRLGNCSTCLLVEDVYEMMHDMPAPDAAWYQNPQNWAYKTEFNLIITRISWWFLLHGRQGGVKYMQDFVHVLTW